MAGGVNKVILVGNLGQDPDVRYTQSGSAVANLRLAVGERRRVGDEWTDHTEWFTVVCFGKTAENAGRFLKKGRQIYVEGRLQTRKWQDREGNDRWSTEVVANQLLFLSGGGDRGEGGGGGYGGGGGNRGGGGGYGGGGGGNRGGGGYGGGGNRGGGGGYGGGGNGGGNSGGGNGGNNGGGGRGGFDDGFQDDGFVDDDIPF